MTTYAPAAEIDAGQAEQSSNYLNCSRGFWSWAGTLDHKRIGIMYLIGVTLAFLAGGVLALGIRVQLWTPEGVMFAVEKGNLTGYNQMFTLHGAFMVFMFIIPAIPASLGNFVLPLMLGAKDVALPRLNLASFYLWLSGTILAIVSIIDGGVDTGWTFYTPYSIHDRPVGNVTAMVLGDLHPRVQLDLHRDEFHRHRPTSCGRAGQWGGSDMPLFVLGDLRHERSSRCWPRRCSASRCS